MPVRTYALLNQRIERADGTGALGLGVQRCRVTFDRTWAPYVQVGMDLFAASPQAVANLDPRAGYRCRFTLTQDDLNGHTSLGNFDLHFRSRDIVWSSGAGSITAVSDEALWQDWAQGSNGIGGYPDNYSGIVEAASAQGYVQTRTLLNADGPRVSLNQVSSIPTPQDEDDYWAPGVSAWDYASQLAELAGAWLFSDELGIFRYAPVGYASNPTPRTFDGRVDLIDVQDTVSRDDPGWATGAVIGYTAPNSTTTQYAVDITGSPRKVLTLQRARKKPASGNPATAVRSKAQQAGRRLTLTSLANLTDRPNQPATATWAGQSVTGTLESVAFTFPEGTQSSVLSVNG